jgi:cytochrome c
MASRVFRTDVERRCATSRCKRSNITRGDRRDRHARECCGYRDVATGGQIFAAKCAACHGAKGEGVIGDRLIGGRGTLTSANPLRTVGSYWPYATTLFDYIRRAMPYNAPQSLSADEVYALSAWILNQNGIVPDDARLDAHSLAAIRMPNRDGFVPDPRPGKL